MNPIWKLHNKGKRNLVKIGKLTAIKDHDFYYYKLYDSSGIPNVDNLIQTNDTIQFLNGDNSNIIGNNANNTISFDTHGNAAYGIWEKGSGINSIVADNFNRTGPGGGRIIASGDYALAMGVNSQASGVASLVSGQDSKATGDYAVAFGEFCDASGMASLAIGKNCETSGNILGSVALGHYANTITTVADPPQIILLERDGGIHNNLVLSVGFEGNILELDDDSNLWIKQGGENGFLNIRKLWMNGQGNYSLQSHNYNDTNNTALGDYSIAMGISTLSQGIASITNGNDNNAYGDYSLALGWNSDASGEASFTIGNQCQSIGDYSFTMGNQIIARGPTSFVGGQESDASGTSIVFGYNHSTDGSSCVVFGYQNELTGDNTTAMGRAILCDVSNATAFGCGLFSSGWCSTVFGEDTTTSGYAATAFGKNNRAIGKYSVVFGYDCSAIGVCNFADGSGSIADSLTVAISIGGKCISTGNNSLAIGYNANATNSYCSAIGNNVYASGEASIVIGEDSSGSGQYAFCSGKSCEAIGSYSIVLGKNSVSTVDASSSFVCGQNCQSSNQYSISMGKNTISSGIASSAFGEGNIATGNYTFVVGKDCSAVSLGCFMGGEHNYTNSIYSVTTGKDNTNLGDYSVCIGFENHITADASFSSIIGGGENQIDAGQYSAILGGFQNKVKVFQSKTLDCTGTGSRQESINGFWSSENTVADMNVERFHFDMGVVNDYMYAVGGQIPTDAVGNACSVKTFEKYDPNNNIWSLQSAQLNEFRLAAVATIGTKIYAIGGSGMTNNQHTAGIPAHWETYTIDTSGSTGLYTSLALADNGNKYISYHSETETNLKSMEISGNTIIETVVDNEPATLSYLPTGLSPGDKFQMVFVTSATTNANDTSISSYNTFVTNTWNSAATQTEIENFLGTTINWKCIGSTSLVDARVNVDTDPGSANFKGIYRFDGTKVVDTSGDLWNTNYVSGLMSEININEDGDTLSNVNVWTGTYLDGTKEMTVDSSGTWLGTVDWVPDPDKVTYGNSSYTSGRWISDSIQDKSISSSLYALSDVLEWPAVPGPNTGLYTSIGIGKVDSSFNTHISYYNARDARLKYAEIADSSGVDLYTVDDASGVGEYSSIAIQVVDASEIRHISYYDASNGDLKYARLIDGSGGWDLTTVDDTSNDAGLWTSIAVSSDANHFISYYDASNGNLNCARLMDASGGWDIITVDDTSNDVGRGTSIAIDSSENDIYISYIDVSNTKLKYATSTNNGLTWGLTSIDTSEVDTSNPMTSIVVDASNGIVTRNIVCYDASSLVIIESTDGVSWTSEMVDSDFNAGNYPSLSIDNATGKKYISYSSYLSTTSSLKFAEYKLSTDEITCGETTYASNTIEVYDTANTNDGWNYVMNANGDNVTIPIALSHTTLEASGTELYISGGKLNDGLTDSSACFSLDTLNLDAGWTTIGSLNQERAHHSMILYDDLLYAVGGTYWDNNGVQYDLSSVEIYDSANDIWITQDSNGCMNASRSDFVLQEVYGLLWAIGGYEATTGYYYSYPDVYDPICKIWTEIDSQQTTLTYLRYGLAGGVIDDNIYVTGGITYTYGTTLSFKDTEKFQPSIPLSLQSGGGEANVIIGGEKNLARGFFNVAFGYDCTVGYNETDFPNAQENEVIGSTAFGYKTSVQSSYSLALGQGSEAKGLTSYSLGSFTTTVEEYSLALGYRGITYQNILDTQIKKDPLVFAIGGPDGTNILEFDKGGRIWLQSVGEITSKNVTVGEVPIGTVMLYAGDKSSIPYGWFECNGAYIRKTTYQSLYDILKQELPGTFYKDLVTGEDVAGIFKCIYGEPTAILEKDEFNNEIILYTSDFFNLPDFRGRTPWGISMRDVPNDPTVNSCPPQCPGNKTVYPFIPPCTYTDCRRGSLINAKEGSPNYKPPLYDVIYPPGWTETALQTGWVPGDDLRNLQGPFRPGINQGMVDISLNCPGSSATKSSGLCQSCLECVGSGCTQRGCGNKLVNALDVTTNAQGAWGQKLPGGYFYSTGYLGKETAPVATHQHSIKQEGVLDPSNAIGHTHSFNLFASSSTTAPIPETPGFYTEQNVINLQPNNDTSGALINIVNGTNNPNAVSWADGSGIINPIYDPSNGYNPCGNGTRSSICPRLFDNRTWLNTTDISMSIPRSSFGIGLINDEVYIMGGITDISNGIATTLCEKYNPVTNTWTAIAPHPLPISGNSGGIWGGVIENKFYAITTYSSKCAKYDPDENKWVFMASMPAGSITSFIKNPTVSIFQTYFMYIIGITTAGFWKTIYFNPIGNLWYDSHAQIQHNLLDMGSATVSVNGVDQLYLAGGRRTTGAEQDWSPEDISGITFPYGTEEHTKQTNMIIDSSENRHIVYNTKVGFYYAFSPYDKFTQKWETQVLNEEALANQKGLVGGYNSMTIDSNNKLHLSYCRAKQGGTSDPTKQSVCYASYEGEVWTFPTGNDDGYISNTYLASESLTAKNAPTCILIGSAGRINILFVGYDITNTLSYGLRYIYSDDNGVTWNPSGPPSGGHLISDWLSATNTGSSSSTKLSYRASSHFASIKRDVITNNPDDDTIYFTYKDPSENQLYFNSLTTPAGTPSIGTPSFLMDCSSSFLFNGTIMSYNQNYNDSQIHILVQPNRFQLLYLRSNNWGVDWNNTELLTFTTTQGGFPSMTVDNNGQVHVVYASPYPLDNTKLYYLTHSSSNIWSSASVIDSLSSTSSGAKNRLGLCSSIAYDVNNLPHISYYNTDAVGESNVGSIPFPTLKYNRLLSSKSIYMFQYVPGKTGTDGWKERKNMPSENYGFSFVPVNEKLYAICGADIQDKSKDTTWLYDPKCDVWQETATNNIFDASRTNLNAITLDVSGSIGDTVLTFGGYDISGSIMDASGRKLPGDPSHNYCDGERELKGDGWRGQEATTSFITDVSGNHIVNNDPYLPPYAVFTYIIKYA